MPSPHGPHQSALHGPLRSDPPSDPPADLHSDRSRAESFGVVAAAYDRFRPGYPRDLIDELLRYAPADALDVCCGTGKAAVALAARGVDVLGVEIDDRMAQVARSHGIAVEVDSFEKWGARGRQFDMITCGQGWHWLDPAVTASKAAGLLRPGGALAVFWNLAHLDGRERERIDAAYEAAATGIPPDSVSRGGHRHALDHAQALFDSGFGVVRDKRFEWSHAYSADEYLGLIATHSDHTALPAADRDRLLRFVREAIQDLGGTLHVRYLTEALIATTMA